MINADYTIVANAFNPLVLSVDTHSEFFTMWEEVSYNKGDFVCEPGRIERYFYVVITGVLAIYLIDKNGEKRVIGFSFDGSFSGVYDSFLDESPSNYYLEALSDTVLMRFSKANYDRLFDLYPEFNYWGRIAHQQLLIGRVKREVELMTLSSEERYKAFMNRIPEPLTRIPQKYLASYLNMTPETFSRMRRLKS